MKKETIFITGSTGCIGHYVVQELLNHTPHHLVLLVRDEKRLKLRDMDQSRLRFVYGTMDTIEDHKTTLKDVNQLIHIATPWGNCDKTIVTNVEYTLKLFNLVTHSKLNRIIYFSTASILDGNNNLCIEAKEYGTPYIKSKYLLYKEIEKLSINNKIFTVFPTAVFGGNQNQPKSHLYDGIPKSLNYLKLLRWLSIDASCHFLHAADIAIVVRSLTDYIGEQRNFVLGRPQVSYKDILIALCKAYSIKHWFSILIPNKFITLIIKILKIEMKPWDKFCVEKRHFTHQVVSPSDFGLTPKFNTIDDIFKDLIKVST